MHGHFRLQPQEVEAFRADGAVVLRGLLRAAEVESLRAGIDANLAQPEPACQGGEQSARIRAGSSRTSAAGKRTSATADSFSNQRSARSQRRSWAAATARLYHDHMLTKEPGTRARTPWHQDQPYYNIEGEQNCSFWIPVDPVRRESTLELVAGSHRGPWLMPRSFMDAQAKWFPEGTLADLPDIEAQRDRYRILGWALEPGDAVCFHMLTLHAYGGRRRGPAAARVLGARHRR